MAHNGKIKLTDYPLVDELKPWEVEKIEKAIAKRLRRDEKEEVDAKEDAG